MATIPHQCPTCSAPLYITQLGCTACDTVITGRYPLSPFARLAPASMRFLESFIRNRGNLKEMEREQGESYWTLRTQLNKIITEMGFEAQPDGDSLTEQRKAILQRVSDGDLTAQEAAQLLSQIGDS